MKKAFSFIVEYVKRADMLLLFLCVVSTVFGIVLISSATKSYGTDSYVYTQVIALVIGVLLYLLLSVIDIDIIADKWRVLLIFGVVFIALLFVVGEAGDSGNRAWIRFGSFGIQPAEVVKITFTIILARQIVDLKAKRGLDHPISVLQLVLHFGLMFGLILVASSDLGSALVYFFIFAVVLFAAGLKFYWFLIAGGAIAGIVPLAWDKFLSDRQRMRILAPYDATIDPSGLDIKWQTNQSKIALASGGFTGTGLYHGPRTQAGAVPQQHTDFIFSVAGEELGFIGCFAITVLLLLIIIRCVHIGIQSKDTLGMLVCIGFAAMLIFQTFENIGMCIGLTPVIGLTLPFFSYGGSSILTLFVAMGIVSGVKMRPKPSRFVRIQ